MLQSNYRIFVLLDYVLLVFLQPEYIATDTIPKICNKKRLVPSLLRVLGIVRAENATV